MKEPEGAPGKPGSRATTVHAERIWDEAWSAMLKCRSRLSMIWNSIRGKTAQERALKGVVWPLPLPFPEVHVRRANRKQVDCPRKLGVNYLVLVLNNLMSPQRHYARVMPSLGTPLNREQWDAVKVLAEHVDVWNSTPPVTSADMGRAASKVESVEDTIGHLSAEAVEFAASLKNYMGKFSSGLQTSWGNRGSPGQEIGTVKLASLHLAKKVEPGRLKFWQTPSFDARPYLDYDNQQTFEFPRRHAEEPDPERDSIPRVSVRCSGEAQLGFLELLDQTGRLALVPPSEVTMDYRNGVFAIPKDESRDRMVLDARPPNLLEHPEKRWIKSLGSMAQFSHIFLRPEEEARLFAEDLREFYHAFIISKERQRRNALKIQVTPSSVAHLSCFRDHL